jgi:uncharacterized membrane protein YdcZ (DUF606 family)
MDRFPLIIAVGGMLLGWIAGTMAHSDPAVQGLIPQSPLWSYSMGAAGAVFVFLIGLLLKRRGQSQQ